MVELIATASEVRWIRQAPQAVPWEIVLFSAKESVFKAWFPLMKTWLGFEQAEIEFLPDSNLFRAHLHPDAETPGEAISEIEGTWEVLGNHVFTAAIIPNP